MSMTADAAIRIDVHSAEVVYFTHTIRYIRQVNPELSYKSYADNRSKPSDCRP